MIEERFDVDGAADLDVSVPTGSLTVDPGPPGSVIVELDTNRPETWHIGQSGNHIWVHHEKWSVGRSARARVRIVAPPGTSINARTASADVRISVPLDRGNLAVASGDIEVGAASSLSVKTASGDVRIDRVERDLDVKSASGDVDVGRVGGSASITSASGDVDIDSVAGALGVSTASGDLRVRRYEGEDAQASTMSGTLRLGLPTGRTVRMDARTLSGSVRLPPRKPASGASDSVHVALRLKSVSGDIVINRLES
ncbi:MAG TPA: DUF4097 family beta strand repeat-containing protein [Acidimicrobiia bacterium]|nr:DUF4097 family beta strand repeat-containing protein [Acidimicrobiia bacterium]